METTEKTMNPKVQEFIENAKKAQVEAQELERDDFLISLGLYSEEIRYIDHSKDSDNYDNVYFDRISNQYYAKTKVAYSVTDEEYEEIKKYAPKKEKAEQTENVSLDNSAEKFLGVLNTISLVICCIAAFILVVVGMDSYGEGYLVGVGIGLAVLSLIYYASMKVVLNISNNLHKINSKMK